MNTKMFQRLSLLSLCICTCAAVTLPCDSWKFGDVGRECYGKTVKHVPRHYLPETLEILKLTATAISSLDSESFRGSDLMELTTLYVTEGKLTSVGEGTFCSLPKLTVLHLDHNQLDTLDELSVNCNQVLRSLSLADNPSLRRLPRLVSSSLESLNLENCNLERIDVHDVEGLTALKDLSLDGNQDLHCPSVKLRFKQARPDLLVFCEDPASDLPSSTFPDDQEQTTGKSFNESDAAINKTKKDSNSDEQHTAKKSLTGSDSAMKNKGKDTAANASSRIPLLVAAMLVYLAS